MSLLADADIAVAYSTLVATANCIITEVATPGRLASNGDPGTPVPVWTGSIRGFRGAERRTAVRAGIEVDVIVETVRVYDAAGGPAAYTAGSDASAHTIVIDGARWFVRGARRDEDGTLDSWLLELAESAA